MTVHKYRNTNQQKLEDNFDTIVNFLNSHGLEVNSSKTSLTKFMSKQKRARCPGIPPDLTVHVNTEIGTQDEHITDSLYCRILGGNLRNNLSWDSHLSSGKKAILPAVRKKLGALHSLRKSLPIKAKLKLVNSFVVSKLSYIVCLWGNTTANQVYKAQVCLNAAARFVMDASRLTRQRDLMEGCNWLTIAELTTYHSLLQLWKVVRWNIPTYMTDRITMTEDDTLSTDNPRLMITVDTWRFSTTLKWNLLSPELRTETDYKKFKKMLRRHIMDSRPEINSDAAPAPD